MDKKNSTRRNITTQTYHLCQSERMKHKMQGILTTKFMFLELDMIMNYVVIPRDALMEESVKEFRSPLQTS